MITQSELKNLFDYVDGQLVAKTDSNKRKAGNALRSITGKGYLSGSINGRTYRVHRLVFLYFHGFMPPQIDHIDGNRQNNQIENLREATSAQNNQNRKATSSSGIKGVVWHKQSKKWVASICINRKSIHLGSFLSIEEAALVANKARQSVHGEFFRGQA
jgi:hypothetical protein